MDSQEQKTLRGDEAQRLMNSPMFEQAFADTRTALLNTWANLDTTDDKYAEFARDLHRKIKAVDSVKRCIQEHITTGKLAQREIDGREKRRLPWAKPA